MSNLYDDSGATISEGTITISTTQDDDGKVVNTPITEMPMMSEIGGVSHSVRCA